MAATIGPAILTLKTKPASAAYDSKFAEGYVRSEDILSNFPVDVWAVESSDSIVIVVVVGAAAWICSVVLLAL